MCRYFGTFRVAQSLERPRRTRSLCFVWGFFSFFGRFFFRLGVATASPRGRRAPKLPFGIRLSPSRGHRVASRFLWCFTGFYRVLPGFTGLRWVSPCFTGFQLKFIGSYWVSKGFSWFLLVFTGLYWVSTGFYWVSLHLLGFNRVLQDFTVFFCILLGFTKFQPGLTGLNLVRLFFGLRFHWVSWANVFFSLLSCIGSN